VRLFYRKYGTAQKTIVILHGLGGISDHWMSVAKILSANYTVLIPDIRNHGRSPHSNEHTYNFLAEDIFELLSTENIPEAVIVGHSMGGKIAMQFAINYPEKTKKLVIIDIAPQSYSEEKTATHINTFKEMLSFDFNSATSISSLKESFVQHFGLNSNLNFLLKNTTKEGSTFKWRLNLHSLIKNKNNISGEILNYNLIHKHGIQTLFIKGANSNYITEQNICDIKKKLPNSNFSIVKDAGHWVHVDNREFLISEIREFISTTPANIINNLGIRP